MSANTTAAPLIGPRDRESFFEAQRRNGRATWRLSAVCVLAAIVMGIPLALTITPLLYAARVAHRRHCQYLGTIAGEFLAALNCSA